MKTTKAEARAKRNMKAIPRDAVLLIPDAEIGKKPEYGIKPGYFNGKQLLSLIDEHKNNPPAIHFIADMLETGNEEDDGFAVMLRNNCSNPAATARIVALCR